MWRPTIAKAKYKQAILGILNSPANNTLLGKVKLFKLLYYIDFDHYQAYKTSVTGDMYQKQPYGPVPMHAQEILSEMVAEGLLTTHLRQLGKYQQHVFDPLTTLDASAFTASEMYVLEQVAQKWANHSMSEIVAATHGEAPWRAVDMGEEIPYALAFYRHQIIKEGAVDEELEPSSASA